MDKLFLMIFVGVIALLAIIIAVKVIIWECKTEKEIEEMEEELNQTKKQRKQEEQELYEALKNLTPRQRKKLGKQIVDLMIKELESE